MPRMLKALDKRVVLSWFPNSVTSFLSPEMPSYCWYPEYPRCSIPFDEKTVGTVLNRCRYTYLYWSCLVCYLSQGLPLRKNLGRAMLGQRNKSGCRILSTNRPVGKIIGQMERRLSQRSWKHSIYLTYVWNHCITLDIGGFWGQYFWQYACRVGAGS